MEQPNTNETIDQNKQVILEKIAQGDTEEAIEELVKLTQYEDASIRNQVIVIKSRYTRLRKEEIQGLVSNEDANLRNNQIRSLLVNFVDQLNPSNNKFRLTQIRSTLSNGDIQEAVSKLTSYSNSENINQDIQNEILLLNHRFRDLDRSIKTNVINSSEADIARNKIVYALLEIIDELETPNTGSGYGYKQQPVKKKNQYSSSNIASESNDINAQIQTILDEPIENLFPEVLVQAEYGDMFKATGDLFVVPCDAAGHVSPSMEEGLSRLGIEHRVKEHPIGSLELQTHNRKNTIGLAYAVTASGEEKSNLEIINNLAKEIGKLASSYPHIICPLLGTGMGNENLNKVTVYQALKKGFAATAPKDTKLSIHIIDQKTFDQIQALNPIVNSIKRSSYHSDSSHGEDQLDITHEVEALANLVASEDLKPPLSIGLFGNWGTGKSFFMEKLHEKVEAISEQSRLNEASTGICKKVVQIKFNAWYYVDANLWASIVSTIFASLSKFLNPETETQKREGQLYKELASTEQQAKIAEEEAKKIEAEIGTVEQEIDRLKVAREQKRSELEGIKVKHIFTTLEKDEKVDEFLKEAKDTLAFKELQSIDKTARESLNEINGLISRYESTLGKFAEISKSLFSLKNPRSLLILILLLLIPIFAFVLLDKMQIWEEDEPYKKVIELLGKIVSIVTALSLSIRHIINKSDDVLQNINVGVNYLDKAKTRLEFLKDQASSETDEQIQMLQHEYEQLNNEHQKAIGHKWQAEKDLKLIKNEIEEIKTGKRLETFIHRRLDSNDYQKHLGLISLIRADFDRLSKYLEKNSPQSVVKEVISEIEEQDQIDRIILYIDDLDRCPPEMVVNVLQAIHLILAFPLFVVVVGVDVRWVSKSILMRYGSMLSDLDNNISTDPEVQRELQGNASPFDYLEKIFQIPFRLRTISESDKQKYIHYLLKNDVLKIQNRTETIEQEQPMKQASNLESRGTQLPISPNVQAETDAQKVSEPVVTKKEAIKEEETFTSASIQKWDLVTISQQELEFIKVLAEIAGNSPRSIKRFINIARLIKSNSRWMPKADSSNTKPYNACLLLLAVIIGLPRMSPLLFKLLEQESFSNKNSKADTLGQLVKKKEIEIGKDIDRYRLINREWDHFRAFVLNTENNDNNDVKAIYLMDVNYLHKVTPMVSRFSFRSMQSDVEILELMKSN